MSRNGLLPFLLALCVCQAGLGAALSMPIGGSVILNPVVDHLGPLSTLTLSQLPAQGPVRKVLVVFVPTAGASEGAGPGVFWDYSPSCSFCTGLPESRSIVIDALARNYAVIASTSITAPEGDWASQAWPADSPDLNNAELVINEWKKKYGLESTPTVGIGLSAGGMAISSIALRQGLFESITVMISGGISEAWPTATHAYPPTLFINMPKDLRTAGEVACAKAILQSKGVRMRHLEWYEHPLTPDWFAQKIPGVDVALSTAIVEALREEGLLGSDNFLDASTIELDWQSGVRSILPTRDGTMLYEASIVQEMKVGIAKHVTISRKNEEIFDWYEGAYEDPTYGPI